MKTRIVEKRQGDKVKFYPEYEAKIGIFRKRMAWLPIEVQEVDMFGVYICKAAFNSLEEAKKCINNFLFMHDQCEQIIHWYPEKQTQ